MEKFPSVQKVISAIIGTKSAGVNKKKHFKIPVTHQCGWPGLLKNKKIEEKGIKAKI